MIIRMHRHSNAEFAVQAFFTVQITEIMGQNPAVLRVALRRMLNHPVNPRVSDQNKHRNHHGSTVFSASNVDDGGSHEL